MRNLIKMAEDFNTSVVESTSKRIKKKLFNGQEADSQKVLAALFSDSSYGSEKYKNVIWNVSRDPNNKSAALVVGLDTVDLKLVSLVVYLPTADQNYVDFEDFYGIDTVVKNLRATSQYMLADHLEDLDADDVISS